MLMICDIEYCTLFTVPNYWTENLSDELLCLLFTKTSILLYMQSCGIPSSLLLLLIIIIFSFMVKATAQPYKLLTDSIQHTITVCYTEQQQQPAFARGGGRGG